MTEINIIKSEAERSVQKNITNKGKNGPKNLFIIFIRCSLNASKESQGVIVSIKYPWSITLTN